MDVPTNMTNNQNSLEKFEKTFSDFFSSRLGINASLSPVCLSISVRQSLSLSLSVNVSFLHVSVSIFLVFFYDDD